MFNNSQVEAVPKNLGLSYRWTNPEQGANHIIVENVIEYIPFSCKVRDLRESEDWITSDTTTKFKKLCDDVASKK